MKNKNDDLDRLVHRFRQGFEPRVFEELFQSIQPRLQAYIYGRGVPAASVGDVSQEVAVGIWRFLQQENPNSFLAILYRIAGFKVADYFRVQKEHVEITPGLQSDLLVEDPSGMENKTGVAQMLGTPGLSGLQREVLLLHYFAGFTIKEVARLMDAPVETTKSRLYLAKARIRLHVGSTRRVK